MKNEKLKNEILNKLNETTLEELGLECKDLIDCLLLAKKLESLDLEITEIRDFLKVFVSSYQLTDMIIETINTIRATKPLIWNFTTTVNAKDYYGKIIPTEYCYKSNCPCNKTHIPNTGSLFNGAGVVFTTSCTCESDEVCSNCSPLKK